MEFSDNKIPMSGKEAALCPVEQRTFANWSGLYADAVVIDAVHENPATSVSRSTPYISHLLAPPPSTSPDTLI